MTIVTRGPRLTLWYLAVALLAVATYFYGLDGDHIPKNGDEYPYEHITRLTAASGHWLPLQSQLDGMRNTKPPLLFWQGIASTDGGRQWTQWDLRYPSVIYTLLTAAMVLLLARRLSGSLATGLIGASAYLAFFSTYHYGRPFLTNPPEVFWFFLPFFVLLYWQPGSFASRFAVPLALGVALGLGFLYKSFALALPVTLGLSAWYLHHGGYRLGAFIRRDALKVAVAVAAGLALFSLWFVLDPDPAAVWREFVVGENAGKFGSGDSYIGKLLWGNSSIWSLALDFFLNSGLLLFPLVGLVVVTFRRRRELGEGEQLLWLWFLALFISFSLPSQRSARYLLSAMPAIAVLCALNWQAIARGFFVASLALALAVLGAVAAIALRLQTEAGGEPLFGGGFWLLLGTCGVVAIACALVPRWTRPGFNAAALLVLLVLAAFMAPLDGPRGRFGAAAEAAVQGRAVWVPCDYRANDERYRFVLPGADIHGYRVGGSLSPAQVAQRVPLIVLQSPLGASECAGCRILGERLDLRGRNTPEEIDDMLRGHIFRHLFVREILVESTSAEAAQAPAIEGCR
jgi:4-amino-4-deoxy-L-arabinose transferase-like glycosyltransferase